MAELNYVYLLIPHTISGAKKRHIVDTILGYMQEPIAIPAPLAEALDNGFLNPGTFYMVSADFRVRP